MNANRIHSAIISTLMTALILLTGQESLAQSEDRALQESRRERDAAIGRVYQELKRQKKFDPKTSQETAERVMSAAQERNQAAREDAARRGLRQQGIIFKDIRNVDPAVLEKIEASSDSVARGNYRGGKDAKAGESVLSDKEYQELNESLLARKPEGRSQSGGSAGGAALNESSQSIDRQQTDSQRTEQIDSSQFETSLSFGKAKLKGESAKEGQQNTNPKAAAPDR